MQVNLHPDSSITQGYQIMQSKVVRTTDRNLTTGNKAVFFLYRVNCSSPSRAGCASPHHPQDSLLSPLVTASPIPEDLRTPLVGWHCHF